MRVFQKLFTIVEWLNRLGGSREFFDPAGFPWVRELEAGWADICQELESVTERVHLLPNFQDIQREQASLTTDSRWKVYMFYAFGEAYGPNLTRCPRTAALLRCIPGMKTAMFSVLRGPKRIPPHRGPFNGVLRYHLALRVPGDPEKCRIRVGSQWRSWHEGRSLVFDDTIEHEVVDELPGARVVLFVDFLRPCPPPLFWINQAMVWAMSRLSFIQDVLRNLDRWNVDYERRTSNQVTPR